MVLRCYIILNFYVRNCHVQYIRLRNKERTEGKIIVPEIGPTPFHQLLKELRFYSNGIFTIYKPTLYCI